MDNFTILLDPDLWFNSFQISALKVGNKFHLKWPVQRLASYEGRRRTLTKSIKTA